MNRADRLEEFILEHGGSVTLGQIIEQGHSSFSYKVTQAVSDLRAKLKPLGKTVKCDQDRETPSKTVYSIGFTGNPGELESPRESREKPYIDNGGQAHMNLGNLA